MIQALTLDLYGTALQPRRPVTVTYAEHGQAWGVEQDPQRLMAAFQVALREVNAKQRMLGDGRDFWTEVVARATGCADPDYFEGLFIYFGSPRAYRLADGLEDCCLELTKAGVRLGVISNADSRTRRVIEGLGLSQLVDMVLLSADLPWDKPHPAIFHEACQLLDVPPARTLHVGDSLECDVEGGRGAGLQVLHWGVEAEHFDQVRDRVLDSRT
jgi:REG-2-like HAD superfamily hydrolase